MRTSQTKPSRILSSSERRLVVGIFVMLLLIVTLLIWRVVSQQPSSQSPADPLNAAQVASGQHVYAAQCASCHGDNLEGQPDWQTELPTGGRPAPPHDANGHTWHHPDGYLFEVTKNGGQARSPPGYKNNMPAFGDKLTDEEIWATLAFIKSQWPPDIQRTQAERNNAVPANQ